ncbi:MAG TPA: TnpV protein [Clostridiales bacterium]|nr:TnpV protein [Clostridiales bacterium]
MEKYDENENLKKEYYDESNGLWYKLKGDYYYPMIAVPKQEKISLGKYGRARLNYIKQHKKYLYTELMMTGTLNQHLAEIDKTANQIVNEIVCEMARKENVPIHYDGKMNQLEWVGLMNNYKNCAKEIIYSESIYY